MITIFIGAINHFQSWLVYGIVLYDHFPIFPTNRARTFHPARRRPWATCARRARRSPRTWTAKSRRGRGARRGRFFSRGKIWEKMGNNGEKCEKIWKMEKMGKMGKQLWETIEKGWEEMGKNGEKLQCQISWNCGSGRASGVKRVINMGGGVHQWGYPKMVGL